MDREFNSGFMPPYMDYNMPPPGMDMNEMMMQYEQACSYYRYLCMQMDYKIKCKEYEKLCNSQLNGHSSDRNNRNNNLRVNSCYNFKLIWSKSQNT